jgi:hypothetical protein
VLPEEILPFKRFSLPAIEKACGKYVPSGPGLRSVVGQIPGESPYYSTLHRWLSGLGERGLDRLRDDLPPVAAMVAESGKRLGRGVPRLWNRRFDIPSWKYLSEERHDQLQACARILAVAGVLFGASLYPLTAWHGWLVSHFNVAPWAFLGPTNCTGMQLTPGGKGGLGFGKKPKLRRKQVKHGCRSPPGGDVAF